MCVCLSVCVLSENNLWELVLSFYHTVSEWSPGLSVLLSSASVNHLSTSPFCFTFFLIFILSEPKLKLLYLQRVSDLPLSPVSLRWDLRAERVLLLCWGHLALWSHIQFLPEQGETKAEAESPLLSRNMRIWRQSGGSGYTGARIFILSFHRKGRLSSSEPG